MFDKAFEEVVEIEGGYVNDPYDSGGETNYGITISVARAYGYDGDMKDLPLSVAKKIYKDKYWDAVRADDFEEPYLRMLLFDTAVNMGVGTAVRKLQKAYNLLNPEEIGVDGVVGLETISSVNDYPYPTDLKFWYVILRGERYGSIVRNRHTQKRFIRGWGRRLQRMIRGVSAFNGSKESEYRLEHTGTDFEGHWAEDAIRACMEKGIFRKTDEFRPNDSFTRAEMATVIERLLKKLE